MSDHTSNVFQFGWKNDESSTVHKFSAAGNTGYVSLSTWTQNTFDLSSETEWKGKKITYLEFAFAKTQDGEDQYHIDWATVAGSNHPHPYHDYAPVSLGANGWNRSY